MVSASARRPRRYSSAVPIAPMISTGEIVSSPRESNSSVEATFRLGAVIPKKPFSWRLTFSYARCVQEWKA